MRGRRRQSDQIKALKGNPHGHGLHLERALGGAPPPRKRVPVEVPSFLSHPREREIFLRVVSDLTESRIARGPDLYAYGRWASYLHLWMVLKEKTLVGGATVKSKSKHGQLLRKRPEFSAMVDLERVLKNLEDRLGLDPVARANYLSGLMALPQPLQTLFDSTRRPATSYRPTRMTVIRSASCTARATNSTEWPAMPRHITLSRKSSSVVDIGRPSESRATRP